MGLINSSNDLTTMMMNATTPTAPVTEPHGPSSRPTLGFPLGTALLLLVVFCLSGVFSCCYHWDKLRRLRGRIPFLPPDDEESADADGNRRQSPNADDPAKPDQQYSGAMQGKEADSLPVIMPGGQIPTYIAWPCPCPPPSSMPPPPPPQPLLPSPPVKIVVVDVIVPPPPRPATQSTASFSLAPSSLPP